MTKDTTLAAYLALAEQLFAGQVAESELPLVTASLAPLDRALVPKLALAAEEAALDQPGRGWAIMAVADAAAARVDDRFLQGQAAWHLARMANEWVQPDHVARAAGRACALFSELGESGWVAASIWQENALPWTRNDFRAAEAALKEALAGLDGPEVARWRPHCYLSLAYAHLLTARYEDAWQLITRAEEVFRRQEGWQPLGRCLLMKANALRRQQQFEEALAVADEAMAIFSRQDAPVDLALANYRRAFILLWGNRDYVAAEAALETALATFRQAGISLWTAQTLGYGLALLYRDTGHLEKAGQALRQARAIYADYDVYGLRADNLIDNGKFALYRGKLYRALDCFEQARVLYEKIGHPFMPAVGLAYQGEAYGRLGRFQEGLSYLEEAQRQFEEVGEDDRVQESRLRLAEIWLQLEQPERALASLAMVGDYYEGTQQTVYLAEYWSMFAGALAREGRIIEAIAFLESALHRLPAGTIRPSASMLQLFLGELFLENGQGAEAIRLLEQAQAEFREMGMMMEEALCQVALGKCRARMGDSGAARALWAKALEASGAHLPDVSWRAHAGLARLATTEGEEGAALDHFRQAIRALARMRRWMWQPALGDHYLQTTKLVFEEAVRLAVRRQAYADTFLFIEEGKTQTLARQLTSTGENLATDSRLQSLEEQIRTLQQAIRSSKLDNRSILRPSSEVRMQKQLLQKIAKYDRQVAYLERQRAPGNGAILPVSTGSERFKRRARQVLGEAGWIALDFYLTDGAVCGLAVTAEDTFTFFRELTPLHYRALEVLIREPEEELNMERALLGRLLIPGEVRARLDEQTFLLIAPHGSLHRLPWAALLLGEKGEPLVARAVPVVIPSLTTLLSLWERAQPSSANREGLLLSITDFDNRHFPLPTVAEESARIARLPDLVARHLTGEEATWEGLQQLQGEEGLSHFAFWHIATHAVHDEMTGRLSGLALYDQDIWLRALWQCSPLPALVTLSACSAGRSKIYAGDEPVGLATTCLAAGAHQVIANLIPLRDDAEAIEIMSDLYASYAGGASPPAALAQAQRAAIARGTSVARWGYFVCLGSAARTADK